MTKKYLLILSLVALSIASITAMEADETNKAIVPTQTETKLQDGSCLPGLPEEMCQEIMAHVIRMSFSDTDNIIPLLKHIIELTSVSKDFSRTLTVVCSNERLKRGYERQLSFLIMIAQLPKQPLLVILTHLTRHILQKDDTLMYFEQKLVHVLNTFNPKRFTNALTIAEELWKEVDKLLIPGLSTPYPLLAPQLCLPHTLSSNAPLTPLPLLRNFGKRFISFYFQL